MSLVTLLDLEPIDQGIYRGHSQWPPSLRVFGGEVAAQSLVAAGRTVPEGRPVHSLHAYFLRPGDGAIPVVYDVEAIRDGGSYTTRRVTARQRGEATFILSASFHRPEEGFAHQLPQPVMTPPEDLPDAREAMAGADPVTREWFAALSQRHPFELRIDGEMSRVATARGERPAPRQRFWFRSREALPEDRLVHSCAATYASDMLLLPLSGAPHGKVFGDADVLFASLDHAVWFHEPFRADDWLYYDQESTWAGHGRAVCRGRMYDRTGRLVVSVLQEGMLRRVDPDRRRG